MNTVIPGHSTRSSAGTDETPVQRALGQAKEQYAQAEEAVKEKAENVAIATERYVGGHPWTSLAVAGSIGMVIGLLLTRR